MTTPHLVIFFDTPREVAYRRLICEPQGHGRLVSLMKQDPSWMYRACRHLETIWDLTGRQPEVQTSHRAFRAAERLYFGGASSHSKLKAGLKYLTPIKKLAELI